MTPVNAPEVVVWATICGLRQDEAAITKYEAKRRCADQSCIEPPQEIRSSTTRLGRAISYCPQTVPASSQTIVKFSWGHFKSGFFVLVCMASSAFVVSEPSCVHSCRGGYFSKERPKWCKDINEGG